MAVPAEERGHGTISMKTYFHYFMAGGGYIFTTIVLIMFILTEVSPVIINFESLCYCAGKPCHC